jgi:hypothetical protein
MNDRERAVNQDLQILGDAYRLDQIRRDEYRVRRRHVLAGLRASQDADTTRKPVKATASDAARHRDPGATQRSISGPLSPSAAANRAAPEAAAVPSRSGVAWKYWLLFGVGLLIVAAAVALLLKSPDDGRTSSTAPASVSPLAELEASASGFADRDDWQSAAIDAWLARWQRADAALRREALARPALQALRDQATYNLSVRKALAAPDDAADSATAGTDAIERMLRALDPAS